MSGLLVRLFERREWRPDMLRSTVGAASAAGVVVTPDTALTYSAVWACVRVLAESVASLPLILYRRLPGGGKERATDHPLYRLLHDQPNDEMSSADWREAQMLNLCLWGNAYSQVVRDRAGRVVAIWPLLSRHVSVQRDGSGKLVYRVSQPVTMELDAREVLHTRAMTLNGVMGISPIAQARQAIGLGLATERFGAAFFANGARPGVILEHPGQLSDEAYARLKESWNAEHQGVENAHKVAILEEGMKLTTVGIPPEDAQFLETRAFQVTEIARWYRIPPHMIGDLTRATFGNIEHQSLEFVTHTLRPWLVRWEQAINRTLLSETERQSLFVEFLVDGLLRGDIQSRYQAYAIARQWGWMSTNDIRERENMNPIPGGDVYFAPLNMTDLARVGQQDEDERTKALHYVYRDAAERVLRRIERDVAEAARKHLARGERAAYAQALAEIERESAEYAERAFAPVAQAHARLLGADSHDAVTRVAGVARRLVSDAVAQLGEQSQGASADEWARIAASVVVEARDARDRD